MSETTSSDDPWRAVEAALATAAVACGAPIRFWLRDDDAIDATPSLDRLGRLCGEADMPILLAVIPMGATAGLARWLADHRFVAPCQHGYAHANHARPGERACELGGDRPDTIVLAELRDGRARLQDRFGTALSDTLVPPWNRIRESLLPALPALGYDALSTFVGSTPPPPCPLPRLDCDLDIIDWRHGRRGRTIADGCRRLMPLIDAAGTTGRPIGVLTHHLAHDEAAWDFLAAFLRMLRRRPDAIACHALLPPAGEGGRQAG